MRARHAALRQAECSTVSVDAAVLRRCLMHTRCMLATKRRADAFPGVKWVPAADVPRRLPHPLHPSGNELIGITFWWATRVWEVVQLFCRDSVRRPEVCARLVAMGDAGACVGGRQMAFPHERIEEWERELRYGVVAREQREVTAATGKRRRAVLTPL